MPTGYPLYLTNANGSDTLYYTLNGADPRVRGGGISPAALAYTAGTPIVVNLPTLVRAVRLDPKLAAGPVVLALADVAALLFYFAHGTRLLG